MAEWLSAEDASKYLGIGSSNLYSLAQKGMIPGHKVGKMWKFSKEELDAWIKANKPIEEFFIDINAHIEGNDFLRIPQVEAYVAAREFFESGKKQAIIQLPVGCGKSGLIAILPLGIANGRVLVIAPNLTIKSELEKTLNITNKRACFWNKCEVLTAETMSAGPYLAVLASQDANVHDCDSSHIVLTNIQQLASSIDKWLPQFSDNYFDMILVDEGHHSAAPSWKKVFDKFPQAKVVNLTATPFRSDNKELEGELIYRYTFQRAMVKGYIKRVQSVYIAPEEIYFTYEGDEHRHSLDEVLELREEEWFSRGVALAPECNRHIVDASLDRLETMRRSGTNHQLIAAAMSIAHARAIRSLYAERGYNAREIHSNMSPDEIEEVIRTLKAGLIDCIIQVQMLGEGFDHPHLSVAAIFRPFRTLPPYVQFIGRIMRVVVQNDPTHPDNYGYVVTHVGMGLDRHLEDLRDMDREDTQFFEGLIQGAELEPPREVTAGEARMKLRPDMVVHKEIVSQLFEENFLQADDQVLVEELKRYAESLGFDAEEIEKAVNERILEKRRKVKAPAPAAILPQAQRREARKRLNEEVKRTARVLLNRVGLNIVGRELSLQIFPGVVSGNNFVAAVQMVNHEVNKNLGVTTGQKSKLRTQDYKSAADSLELVLNTLVRRIKKRMVGDE